VKPILHPHHAQLVCGAAEDRLADAFSRITRSVDVQNRRSLEVLLYRPMFWVRGSRPPAESDILLSFGTDFAGG
jgi:hypothetical protein